MRAADRTRAWVSRWWRGEEKGAIASALKVALAPAEGIFRAAVRVRASAFDRGIFGQTAAPVPVVSVGNLTVGGTGKTPICAWVAQQLVELGERPAIILRGYGEDEIGVHRVLNPEVPVVAERRRIVGVRAARLQGASCAILDDGFQHRILARDLDIVLVSADSWGASASMLPRGPFREPISALGRAGQVFVTRKTADLPRARDVVHDLRSRGIGVPMGVIHLVADEIEKIGGSGRGVGVETLAGRRVVAVSSLADPTPFIERLREAGARVEPLSFPDHHEFDSRDRNAIVALAGGDPIVMTLKEAVKLRSGWPAGVPAFVLRQRVIVEEGLTELRALLTKAIRERGR